MPFWNKNNNLNVTNSKKNCISYTMFTPLHHDLNFLALYIYIYIFILSTKKYFNMFQIAVTMSELTEIRQVYLFIHFTYLFVMLHFHAESAPSNRICRTCRICTYEWHIPYLPILICTT